MNKIIGGAAGVIAAVGLAFGTAACGGTTVTKITTPAPSATSAPAAAPAPGSNPATGPVGTTFSVHSYTVTLVRVDQNAHGAGRDDDGDDDSPNTGRHFVAAEFQINGMKSSAKSDDDRDDGDDGDDDHDDANSNAVAQGTDQRTYPASSDSVDDGHDFDDDGDDGHFNSSPGSSARGWVTFQLPSGVSVAHIHWTDGSQTVTWNVG
jgi:hypothetical protein